MCIRKPFYPEERLFRAVSLNNPDMWEEKYKKISSAVFKDSQGPSVDRQWHRSRKAAIDFLYQNRLINSENTEWGIVSITKLNCDQEDALCLHKPDIPKNIYHSEIHQSTETIKLSRHQARALAKIAIIEQI